MRRRGDARTRAEVPGAFRAAVATFVPIMSALTRRSWRGGERLPARGGVLVCVNHVSYADPLAVAHFLVRHGRRPTFLAKASLFAIPLVGRWIAACGQIPVHRGEARAGDALLDGIAAIEAGRCVVVMPESTVTKDPEYWPMTAKTGAARIALATRVPVFPLAQWGAQDLLGRDMRLHPLRRPRVSMRLGEPVDLADLYDRPLDADVLRDATDRIMAAIVAGVEDLRGRPAPPGRWDLREGRRVGGPAVRADDPAGGTTATPPSPEPPSPAPPSPATPPPPPLQSATTRTTHRKRTPHA